MVPKVLHTCQDAKEDEHSLCIKTPRRAQEEGDKSPRVVFQPFQSVFQSALFVKEYTYYTQEVNNGANIVREESQEEVVENKTKANYDTLRLSSSANYS